VKVNEFCDEFWSQPERCLDADRFEDVLFARGMEIVRGTSIGFLYEDKPEVCERLPRYPLDDDSKDIRAKPIGDWR
jgi:hypothetical protein